MKTLTLAAVLAISLYGPTAVAGDFATSLRSVYPSLSYVERYREAYPQDVVGSSAAWQEKSLKQESNTAIAVTQLLTGLADQHVALSGPKAGKPETLGVLFRTSSDGQMVVWRIIDPAVTSLKIGDRILAIDDVATPEWLGHAAALTFGGNHRSRQAEAALSLALGTRAVHEVAALGQSVNLRVQSGHAPQRNVRLPYQPMTSALAGSLAAAVDKPDLPTVMRVGERQIVTIRIGAFAPQYDPVFTAAADAMEKSSAGSEDTDAPMLAGFCAVTQKLIERHDALSSRADFILIDLRGNMGGFAREVRAFAWALTGRKPEKTYDMVVSGQPGTVRLQELPEDPSCGVVRTPKPLLVLIDAGTRSSGELLATYLWESGAIVVGERTVGAGGGRDSQSKGIAVGDSGYSALVSEDFYVFDPTNELHPGDIDEQRLIDRVAEDRFGPSRVRPYMTQAVGVRPDIVQLIEASDLEDGGRRLVERSIAGMRLAH